MDLDFPWGEISILFVDFGMCIPTIPKTLLNGPDKDSTSTSFSPKPPIGLDGRCLSCFTRWFEVFFYLGGGFKYFSFSPLLGERIQFDDHIFRMG